MSWLPWGRPRPEPSAAGLEYDVTIDLGPRNITGQDAGPAMAAARKAAAALPGVQQVSVGRHDGRGATRGLWVRVTPPGRGTAPVTAAWTTLRTQVEAAVTEALDILTQSAAMPDYDVQHVHRALGFADGTAYTPAPFRPPSGAEALSRPASPAHGSILAGDAAALDDLALTSALLSLVLPTDPAPLAERIVAQFGSFAGVLSAPVLELELVPGLGPHSVAAIKLIHATALRAAQADLMHRPVLDDMKQLTDYLSAVLARERIEQFRILFLDEKHQLVADEAQARGTVNHTPVYPREVVRRAIELRAAHLILVHNHPSGDPTPSREDVEMTGMVRQAAALLGIGVQDHIIVGNGQWTSFREQGLL